MRGEHQLSLWRQAPHQHRRHFDQRSGEHVRDYQGPGAVHGFGSRRLGSSRRSERPFQRAFSAATRIASASISTPTARGHAQGERRQGPEFPNRCRYRACSPVSRLPEAPQGPQCTVPWSDDGRCRKHWSPPSAAPWCRCEWAADSAARPTHRSRPVAGVAAMPAPGSAAASAAAETGIRQDGRQTLAGRPEIERAQFYKDVKCFGWWR